MFSSMKLTRLGGRVRLPITKSLAIKSEFNLKRAVKYIINPDKTNSGTLTSGYLINSVNNAYFEMGLTRQMAQRTIGYKNKKSDNEVLARHLIQSFDPNDNLSPEEIHEIGRQTVLELTGGNHEFIIATHVDKDHIHNHIIFNATSSKDFKKFRWQKGTTALLRNISDRISDYHGALVLDSPKKSSHTKYLSYQKQNQFRNELKERLNFLKKNSLNWDDFLRKAELLNVAVEYNPNSQSKDYGNVLRFKLTDLPQQRYVRDYTLNKKYRLYNYEEISKQTLLNKKGSVCYDYEIKEQYDKLKVEKAEVPDVEFKIQKWQIERDTMTGIYLAIRYGREEEGIVKIPDYKLDKNEDGTYSVFLKKDDMFYFLNEDDKNKSHLIKGEELAYAITSENGVVIRKKNSAIQNVRNMTSALNLLSIHNVKGAEAVEALGKNFVDDFDLVKNEIKEIDNKIIALNEKLKFDKDNYKLISELSYLQDDSKKLKNSLSSITQELKNYQGGRQVLKQKDITIGQPDKDSRHNKVNNEQIL